MRWLIIVFLFIASPSFAFDNSSLNGAYSVALRSHDPATGLMTFDGAGGVQVELTFLYRNNQQCALINQGTYIVNDNGSGQIDLLNDCSRIPTYITLNFVLDSAGSHFQFVQIQPPFYFGDAYKQ